MGLKIRVSVVRFRPRPPVFMRPSARFGSWGVSTKLARFLQKVPLMGHKSAKKPRFFDRHPTCCFCGMAPSQTIDHIPARGLFLNRQWAEGYEFPACTACNSGSSDDELMMSLLVRLRLAAGASPQAHKEVANAISGLKHRMPELQRQFKEVSRTQTRQYFRERGLSSPRLPGVGELYLMKPPDEVWRGVERYGLKLGKAHADGSERWEPVID